MIKITDAHAVLGKGHGDVITDKEMSAYEQSVLVAHGKAKYIKEKEKCVLPEGTSSVPEKKKGDR